jgi:TonB family protein
MLISITTFGQEKKQFSDEIKGVKVSPPRFIANEELLSVLNETQFGSLNDYLISNIQYPENSKKWKEEGTEVIQFVVTTKGDLTDFKVINSVSPAIDQEVIRVLKTTNGLWRPGLNNEKPVAMGKEVSIVFKLENTNDFTTRAKRYYTTGAKMLLIKERPKLALMNYNQAVTLLPNDKCILLGRGMAKYELGDKSGACQDWNRIKALGGFEGDVYLDNYCEMKGYSDMISTIQGKE